MWFGKREYRLMAQVAGTQVSGDTAAMLRLQTSSARYFQRPDRGNGSSGVLSDAYDPALTALRGVGAYARFARESGHLLWEVSTNPSTDSRKNVVLSGSAELGCNRDGDCSPSASLTVQLRPASNLSLSLGPSVSHDVNRSQYVTTVPDPTATAFYGNRYVFADLVQNTIAMNTRFNITFSPNLTLELFVQPLIASGAYSRYKEFAAPRGLRRLVYGADVGTDSIKPGNPSLGVRDSIFIDPDGGGPAARFVIVDPSFTLRSLRGNAVLRWEYRPGSTLYLVWTRSGSSSLMRGAIDFGDDARALFRGPSENIFLVKLNYWLGL